MRVQHEQTAGREMSVDDKDIELNSTDSTLTVHMLFTFLSPTVYSSGITTAYFAQIFCLHIK